VKLAKHFNWNCSNSHKIHNSEAGKLKLKLPLAKQQVLWLSSEWHCPVSQCNNPSPESV